MKLGANRIIIILSLLLLVSSFTFTTPLLSNSCPCPEPPGGSVDCPAGLTPVCIIKEGKVITSCAKIASISGASSKEQKEALLLSRMLNMNIQPNDLIDDQLLSKIHEKGGFRTSGLSLTYKLSPGDNTSQQVGDLTNVTDIKTVNAVNSFAKKLENGFTVIGEPTSDPFVRWRPGVYR